MMLTEQQIEELAEQFEEQWCEELTGPIALERFLQRSNLCDAQEYPLICTLASIDIELAWQAWNKSLDALSEPGMSETLAQAKCEELLARLNALPRVEHYLPLLRDWDRHHAAWTQLLQCEAMARTHWGDNVGVDYYEQRFGTAIQLSGRLPVRALQVSKCNAGRDVAPPLKAVLRGVTHVGRQRLQDATGWGQIQELEETRVIIADRKDTRISRDQLQIYLLNPRFVIVRNGVKETSNAGSQSEAISPGQYRLVPFPFIIKINDNRLVFD